MKVWIEIDIPVKNTRVAANRIHCWLTADLRRMLWLEHLGSSGVREFVFTEPRCKGMAKVRIER